MEVRKQLEKIADEYEALKIENKQLRIDNQGLRLEIERNHKQFEEILEKTKRSYKSQYKKHTARYEHRIQELIRRIKKMGGSRDTSNLILDVDLPPPELSVIKPIASKIKPISTKRININSSPTKHDIPSTQYSSDTDSEISQVQRAKQAENLITETSVYVETSNSAELMKQLSKQNQKYTPLQKRAMINEELINKYMDDPEFKVRLTLNPITEQGWNLLDFKRIDRGEEETPPFMWIKDNTSQEDLIKQQVFESKNQQLVDKCFQQCLNGTNKFEYEILNKYVEANRYIVDEKCQKI